jgi:Uma2 family endonuclease
MSSVLEVTAIDYPESDGKPMGETDEHREVMILQLELLQEHFQGQRVYVSGNLLVYYQQGNPKRYLVPDVFVVKGIEPKKRRVYKIWLEGKAPDVVIEVTSRKTKRQDTVVKPKRYARLGVKEYFLYDPTSEYLDPPLQGYRLVGNEYQRLEPAAPGALVSDELGLRLQLEPGTLAFYRLDTGERLLTNREARQSAEVAQRAAEAELARLREELRRRTAAEQ